MARKRRTSQNDPRARGVNRVLYRHDKRSQDIDSAHARIRDITHRVDAHESRITGIETRQREERDMIADARADLLLLKRENERTVEIVEITKTLVENVKENLASLSKALDKHIRVEASDYSTQTKRIEGLSRRMLLAWVSFSGLAVICYAIYTQITGSSVRDLVGDLIPFILGGGA